MPASFAPALIPPAELSRPHYRFFYQNGHLLTATADAQPVREGIDLPLSRSVYLGRLDGIDCLASETAAPAPAGYAFRPLRAVLNEAPPILFSVLARGAQLLEWDRAHQFCGCCGAPTLLGSQEGARLCTACGHAAWPRLSPAIMVLVQRQGQLLLARSAHFPPGRYSALAGFVEAGETLEDAVAREVREEVGIEVCNIRYFASQSWPFPHQLMIAFTADHAAGELQPDAREIEAAAWFSPEGLPNLPEPCTLSRKLIDAVVAKERGA